MYDDNDDVASLNVLLMTPETNELVGDCPYCHIPKYKWESEAEHWHCPGCHYDFPRDGSEPIAPSEEAETPGPVVDEPNWPVEVDEEEANWPGGRPEEDEDTPGPVEGMEDDDEGFEYGGESPEHFVSDAEMPDENELDVDDVEAMRAEARKAGFHKDRDWYESTESVIGKALRLREEHLWGQSTQPRAGKTKEAFFAPHLDLAKAQGEPNTAHAALLSPGDEQSAKVAEPQSEDEFVDEYWRESAPTSTDELNRFGEWDTDARIFKAMGEQRVFCENVEHGDLGALREVERVPLWRPVELNRWESLIAQRLVTKAQFDSHRMRTMPPKKVTAVRAGGGKWRKVKENSDAKITAVADSLKGVIDIFFPELKDEYTRALETGDTGALKMFIHEIDKEVLSAPQDFSEEAVRVCKRIRESFMSDLDLQNQEAEERGEPPVYTDLEQSPLDQALAKNSPPDLKPKGWMSEVFQQK